MAAKPAGYSWIIDQYGLSVPIPTRLAGIGETHSRVDEADWLILSPRHEPEATLAGHITFGLKNEGVELSVLKALAQTAHLTDLESVVRASPNGKYVRRFWFLMEWLGAGPLTIPDASSKRGLEPVLDPSMQYSLHEGEVSERHRVINNLPGTPEFCPLVRRSDSIEQLADRNLGAAARALAGRTHPDVMARASAFLLLSDSKASFQIESEQPSPDRTRRWAQAIARAGSDPLSLDGLLELQRIVIGDARFVKLGLREGGGFIGGRDRLSRAPIPEHISARASDVASLVQGILDFTARARQFGMEPVAATASVSFGFVYTHPFEDGNGRIHRWLIHHLLSVTGLAPESFVFPVSQVMLRRIGSYRRVLESYSSRVLPLIDWAPTPDGNVEVLNQTADHYRFFDATAQAEFLYRCVAETVDEDLPREVQYLEAFDRFSAQVQAIVDMPEQTLDLLRAFLEQNGGRLSARARSREFEALTGEEAQSIETIYAETLGVLAAQRESW